MRFVHFSETPATFRRGEGGRERKRERKNNRKTRKGKGQERKGKGAKNEGQEKKEGRKGEERKGNDMNIQKERRKERRKRERNEKAKEKKSKGTIQRKKWRRRGTCAKLQVDAPFDLDSCRSFAEDKWRVGSTAVEFAALALV